MVHFPNIEMQTSFNNPAYPSRSFEVLAAAAVGLGAFALTTAVAQIPAKLLAGTFIGGVVFWVALASGYVKPILIAFWAASLTYNRMYFIFEPIVGYQGGQGPYVIVSDFVLLLLFGLWAFELILTRTVHKPRGAAMWPWLLPFLIAAIVSLLQSPRPDWGFYELLRYVKFGLVVMYFRYQVGVREWWACVLGILFALLFQGSLSIAEIVSGRSGLLGVLGIAKPLEGPQELRNEVFLGWHRATATMNHPPQLACYFIFTTPVAFALGFGTRDPRVRFSGRLVGLIALGGLACTMSRWPCTLMAVELVLLFAGLVALRLSTAKEAIAVGSLALLAIGVAVFTFRDPIMDRLFRDLNRSIEFRKKEGSTGIAMAKDHPYFGVGLNNYFHYLLSYQPDWEWAIKYEELAVKKQRIRPLAAPHSAYLSILAETGGAGFIAYAMFLGGIFFTTLRAVRQTRGPWRAIVLALAIGLTGHFLQQLVDFSMLFDPLLYTMAMVMGLATVAPDLCAQIARCSAGKRSPEVMA